MRCFSLLVALAVAVILTHASVLENDDVYSEDEWNVIQGNLHLIRLDLDPEVYRLPPPSNESHVSSYAGQVKGVFCALNFTEQKQDPSQVPFYNNVIRQSKCGRAENQVVLDFHQIVTKAKQYFQRLHLRGSDPSGGVVGPHSIRPTGFVYHTGRCGSTLVSNSLMAMDPTKTKLYSEPWPARQALLACDKTRVNCNIEKAVELFRDTVYVMGITNDPVETRMFFKLLPTSILAKDVITRAFPSVPWMFVYRDPVHLLVSNMKDPKQKHDLPGPYCTEGMKDGAMSEFMADVLYNAGVVSVEDLSMEEYCAAFLATIIEGALEEATVSTNGVLVNYENLNAEFLFSLFQDHFNLDAMSKERIEGQFRVYSKRMLSKTPKEAKDDSKDKMEAATNEIVAAAEFFMQLSYDGLQSINTNGMDNALPVEKRLTRRDKSSDSNVHVYDPLLEERRLQDNCASDGVICCAGGTPLEITNGFSSTNGWASIVGCTVWYGNVGCGADNLPPLDWCEGNGNCFGRFDADDVAETCPPGGAPAPIPTNPPDEIPTTLTPSQSPSKTPSTTSQPDESPSSSPSVSPVLAPPSTTSQPDESPSSSPSVSPVLAPPSTTSQPDESPSSTPSASPVAAPIQSPIQAPIPSPNAEPTSSSSVPLEVIIQLDDYARETGWSLFCNDTQLAARIPGFYEGRDSELIEESFETFEGATCTFTIEDAALDGICCDYGIGFYEVYVFDQLVGGGGEFGEIDSVSFTVQPATTETAEALKQIP